MEIHASHHELEMDLALRMHSHRVARRAMLTAFFVVDIGFLPTLCIFTVAVDYKPRADDHARREHDGGWVVRVNAVHLGMRSGPEIA